MYILLSERKYDTLNSDFFGKGTEGRGNGESRTWHFILRCCLNVLTMRMQHLNHFFQQSVIKMVWTI